MSIHGGTEAGHGGWSDRHGWGWWILTGLGIVAFIFGAWGMYEYEAAHARAFNLELEAKRSTHVPGAPEEEQPHHVDYISIAYHTLQLFLLHAPHLEGHIPWQLHVGRLLAAFVALLAVVKALARVVHSEWRLLTTHLRGGHVVICGLGRVGLQLAREYRATARVVAIEAEGHSEQTEAAYEIGVTVLRGDACNSAMLLRASVIRAKQVIAVCDDEQTNVAIAAMIGGILKESRRGFSRSKSLGALACWIFVSNAQLRRGFRQSNIFPHTDENYVVNVRGLDLFATAARQALLENRLDIEPIKDSDATVVHLIVVGCGEMGQQLALHAAQSGHFANAEKLRLTLVDRHGSAHFSEFQPLAKIIQDNQICDFEKKEIKTEPSGAIEFLAALAQPKANKPTLTTIALCWDRSGSAATSEAEMFQHLEREDAVNLAAALELAEKLPSRNVQFLVFQTRTRGFGALFPVAGRGAGLDARVRAFGMLEKMCSLQNLVREENDSIARVLHESYFKSQLKKGKAEGSKPALYSWERLSDHYKDSNRQAADHIYIKMRALGYRVEKIHQDPNHISKLDDKAHQEQVLVLAELEHRRWCAERWLDGWTKGEQNDEKKTHPCLIPWKDLDPDTKKWDWDQVVAIPEALNKADFGIYK